ncbi:MAPEG family protein [Ferrimonas pelagia]|uniref:MAPEG family protein n=1 Tax=Ferrimonas pelagia TaxID=1177826 RepID=A0ABP9EIN8_9GAMM
MATVVLVVICLALLPYLLAGYNGLYKRQHLGGIDMHHPRQQDARLENKAHRIAASQRNAWEALGFFSACVLAALLREVPPQTLTTPAILFFITRLLHPIFYIGDWPPARSLTVVIGIGLGLYLAAWAG